MHFNNELVEAILIKRYKRFLADVTLKNGKTITVHTPNTGSMMGCSEPGSRVWIRDSGNPERKYQFSWELVEAKQGVIIGINTILANKIVQEGIQSGRITELSGFKSIKSEVAYGKEKSRVDFLLRYENKMDCYVEVKNVTLAEDAKAYFPDAVSMRASKHLRELIDVVKNGMRGVLIFCIQRCDAKAMSPADHIDPEYGILLREAISKGVDVLAYQANVSTEEIIITNALPVICSQ